MVLAAACSRSANGTGFTPAATAPSGATILPNGFRSVARVAVAYDPSGRLGAPNSAWTILPGTLRATFYPALGVAMDAKHPGVRLTMPYPQDRAGDVLAAQAPVVSVVYAGGRSLRWPAPGYFDLRNASVTVDLPAGLLEHATSITLALAVDDKKFKLPEPGPRYWTGKVWSQTGDIQTGKKTVVLIHGIFSSVESSFPTPRPWQFWSACPKRIAVAGKFDQVLGFDYAWNEPPEVEGKLFADFLKQVGKAKPASLTIEAHSYGSLVTLAALPKLGSDATAANVVTMGGPLPLRGTPLAKPENHWRMGMVLGLLSWYFDEPPSVIDRAYKSGMVASLATDSDDLKTILSDLNAMQTKPNYVQVAGTKWICFIPGIKDCNYSEETFKKQLIDGSGVQLPWDGVVETIAADSTDIPGATSKEFGLSHIDLQCDDGVIGWIAKQLK